MTTTILAADAPLDHAALDRALSVLSYNILLPNTGPGWWIFKFYDPSVPEEARTWPHRHALLREQLRAAHADVICLQETTPTSFDQDFAFLRDEGYDHALHRKGDLRCATFWRRDRLALAAEPKHPDRVLVTALGAVSDPSRTVLVLNGHLKAGSDAGRRLRQVDEALGEAAKIARALGQTPDHVPVVFCGDFNSEPAGSGVSELLRVGEVPPTFREPGHADALTSKHRTQPFGRFDDAHAQAFDRAPATMLVHNHHRYFVDDEGMLRAPIVEALRVLFTRFAGGQAVMDREAVTAWITAINRAPGRGSEWTKARAIFEARGVEQLTEEDLISLYIGELREGKSWGVYHDLCACGVAPPRPVTAPNEWRFDQIHYTASTLTLLAVRALLTDAQREAVFDRQERMPNAWHPSDHLPVSAILGW